MRTMHFSYNILLCLGAGNIAFGHPGHEIFQRAGPACNADNCLRAFRAESPATRARDASSFCSMYLSTSIPAVTVTVSATTTSISTPERTTTTNPPSTSVSTVFAISTTTVTGNPVAIPKREITSAFPSYATACTAQGITSQAARVKSACSCLIINSPATTTTTAVSTIETTVAAPITTLFTTTTQTITSYTSVLTSYVAPACSTPIPGYPVSPVPAGKVCGTIYGSDTGANLYLPNDQLTREQCVNACKTGSFALPCKAIGVKADGSKGCKILYNEVNNAAVNTFANTYAFFDAGCFTCPAS